MGSRHRGRELALQALYQADLAGEPVASVLRQFGEEGPVEPSDEETFAFAERLARGVARRRDRIDALIQSGSENWRLERMAVIERNAIRLALFELIDDPDTPPAVVLDEAVELAKTYGGEASGAFVNGVLDGIRRRLDAGELER